MTSTLRAILCTTYSWRQTFIFGWKPRIKCFRDGCRPRCIAQRRNLFRGTDSHTFSWFLHGRSSWRQPRSNQIRYEPWTKTMSHWDSEPLLRNAGMKSGITWSPAESGSERDADNIADTVRGTWCRHRRIRDSTGRDTSAKSGILVGHGANTNEQVLKVAGTKLAFVFEQFTSMSFVAVPTWKWDGIERITTFFLFRPNSDLL